MAWDHMYALTDHHISFFIFATSELFKVDFFIAIHRGKFRTRNVITDFECEFVTLEVPILDIPIKRILKSEIC